MFHMTSFTKKLEELKIPNPTLRDCFDPYSSEYSDTTINEKISTLIKVLENGYSLSNILKEYCKFYNSLNKPHVVTNIHLGLKKLINQFLVNHTTFRIKEFEFYDNEDLIFVLAAFLQNPNKYNIEIKSIFYKQLVDIRKRVEFEKTELINPSELNIQFDQHLNAWAYWCGNLDAEILLIGQDFGNKAYYTNNNGKDELGNETNLNLQILFKQIDINLYDINQDNKDLKLYFTNAVLGAKLNGGMAGKIRKDWYSKTAITLTKPLIEIINPKIIIAMGSTALKVVSIIYKLKKMTMKNAVSSNATILPDNKKLFVVYHCSKLGQISRKFEEQKLDWQNIKKHLNLLSE